VIFTAFLLPTLRNPAIQSRRRCDLPSGSRRGRRYAV